MALKITNSFGHISLPPIELMFASYLTPLELLKLGACSRALSNLCIQDVLWKPRTSDLRYLAAVLANPIEGLDEAPKVLGNFHILARAFRTNDKKLVSGVLTTLGYPLENRDNRFCQICLGDDPQGKEWACYRTFMLTLKAANQDDRNVIPVNALQWGLSCIAFHISQTRLYTDYIAVLESAFKREQWDWVNELLEKAPPESAATYRLKALALAQDRNRPDLVNELSAKIARLL